MRHTKSVLVTFLTAAAIFLGPLVSEASATQRRRHRSSRRQSYSSRSYGGHRYRPNYRGYRGYRYYRPHYRPYSRSYYRPYSYWPYYSPYAFTGPYYGGQGGYAYYRGAVRTKVKPVETEVYVDGYYAGVVDDFDGIFQKLYVSPGEHEIELRLAGYRSYSQNLLVRSGHTQKIHHEMRQLAPGETNPPPPESRKPQRYEESEIRESPPDRPEAEPGRQGGYRGEEASRPTREEQRTPDEPQRSLSAAHFGMLSLRVQPAQAEVLIDGERWGSLEGFEELVIHLPAGQHQIEIRQEGYQPFVTGVDIRQGETTPLNVRLAL